MLWKVVAALLALWLILLVSRNTASGKIHALFVLAVAIGLYQILWRKEAI